MTSSGRLDAIWRRKPTLTQLHVYENTKLEGPLVLRLVMFVIAEVGGVQGFIG